MADFIAAPLKKPTEVDIVKPLKNLISASYSTADKPEDYSDAINELSKIRNNAVWRVFEKYESSLEVIYGYYDQLCALEAKIPAHEVQIPFKWKDAFDKGTFFGGRISLTVSSLSYEKVCVLFNIAALQSAVASSQSLVSDEGLKLAAKLFQQSAGIFNHLKATVMLAIQQDPTPDLNPDCLAALGAVMLAQAQEMFAQKAMHDNMKPAVIAKLCAQAEELYAEALKALQKEQLKPLWERDWITLVAGKQASFHGLAEYFQGLVAHEDKAIGEEISRLEKAVELLKAGQQRSGRPTLFEELTNKATRALNDAKKDNDFIYHERIPDYKNLTPVSKAAIAKALPLPKQFSQNFKDLFENLVPVTVHQAMAAYEVRKSEIINGEVSKLRDSTNMLNSILASLNLPAALEESVGGALPQSLVEKSNAIVALGGVDALNDQLTELPELLQRNRDILNEAERLLKQEQEQDDQLRERFKSWSRTPSVKLTETFRANLAKYREIINNAVLADKVVREKFESHSQCMKLLSQGANAINDAVPSASSAGVSSNSLAFRRLKELMEEVEIIKAERSAIESELKSATIDMKSTFLSALAQDGAINEAAISTESLGRAFGPLQQQVKESLLKQERVVAEIQTQHSDFIRERSANGGASAQREQMLMNLAAAHDAYMELQSNLKEGAKFYNDLTQLLVAFQNKISDFCFARKTEVNELLENIAHEKPAEDSSEIKKAAPPRPPPPTTSPTSTPASHAGPSTAGAPQLPYPAYPTGMPVPYGASSAVPYPSYVPPPMPQSYNPYAGVGGAGVPYPQQGENSDLPASNTDNPNQPCFKHGGDRTPAAPDCTIS
ncbi:Programmed cell death 6-interacting protein [Frankliniella fusca]|uniref:Programmed cell death 6-interacting protein n=1 Tax=Frankliniella fusca TaxID=407009 RepID=A0AAE1H2A9_9NEOP|nr:Programmed cell death 6-interacting protein [Frankliniella fusca]